MFRSQLHQELIIRLRNGEQLLLVLAIPIILLVIFSTTEILPINGLSRIDFVLPGILALSVMSTSMVSLGISTGFERSYGVLKRLGTTPLGTSRLVLTKIVATVLIEILQLSVLILIGRMLGWSPSAVNWVPVLLGFVLGSACFAGIGLTMAGKLRAETNLAAQNGLYLLLMLFGGMIFPVENLPNATATIARYLPSTILGEMLRTNLVGTHDFVYSSILKMSVWTAISCLLAIKVFRWTE